MPKFKDLTGKRFGRWTVLYRTHDHIEPDGTKRVMYHCRCDCGNEADVISGSLSKNKSRSCGCLQREWAKSGNSKRTHGETGTRLHRVWKNMHTRCYNANSPKFVRYGGRGIKICDAWLGDNGFQNFERWAITHGYKENLTIDRIDNDGNYEPNNCRWITNKENSRNKSTNRNLTVKGLTKTIAEWVEITGIRREKPYYTSDDKAIKIIESALLEK